MRTLLVVTILLLSHFLGFSQNPTVFKDINFGGKSVELRGSCMNFNNHNNCEISWDNQISSINVPNGWTVIIYDQIDYKGNSYTLKESISDLNKIGWNDRTNSIYVIAPNGNALSGFFWPSCIQIKVREIEPREPREPRN